MIVRLMIDKSKIVKPPKGMNPNSLAVFLKINSYVEIADVCSVVSVPKAQTAKECQDVEVKARNICSLKVSNKGVLKLRKH